MRDNNNSLAERTQALVLGFALGDALGSPFEFATPNEDDTRRSFYETEKLEFTDDTMLVLSTLHAYEKSRHLPDYPANVNFWGEMHQHTCFWLVDWLESGDLRGMGNTSLAAIKQMRRHAEEHGTFESFGIMSRGYNADMSSGNGILSRALPLLALGIAHDPAFSRWLNLTHLHADGHLAVEDLWRWLISEEAPAFRFSETAPGFYQERLRMLLL
jgi:ADP-ribosylglycohydrolase